VREHGSAVLLLPEMAFGSGDEGESAQQKDVFFLREMSR